LKGSDRFLVTGALGCIGAWTVRELVKRGMPVTALDRSADHRRLAALMSPDDLARVTFVAGDITSPSDIERVVVEQGITNLIHLAALQIPFCKADPVLGAMVNVAGTVSVFESAKRHRDQVRSVVYMSSIGMYDAADAEKATNRLREDAIPHPRTHYGVYKLANEGTATIYWQDDGVPSIGLRPYIVYGPGRDQGLTAAPTLAMQAAAEGRSFHIGFGGRAVYQYTGDINRQIVEASLRVKEGAAVYNLDGSTVEMDQIVAAIKSVVPSAKITYDDVNLPFPADVDRDRLTDFLGGSVSVTDLGEATRLTIEHFKSSAARQK
jgi:UDP-glucuronate 4-epimerase